MPRGRPPTPVDQRYTPHNVRLSPQVADAVTRYALQHRISVYALLGRIIDRVFARQIARDARSSAYDPPQSSTLSAVLSESPSSRASRTRGRSPR